MTARSVKISNAIYGFISDSSSFKILLDHQRKFFAFQTWKKVLSLLEPLGPTSKLLYEVRVKRRQVLLSML